MPIRCPKCGVRHDAAKFEGNKPIRCPCGFMLDISFFETFDDFSRYFESEKERCDAEEIQEDAMAICRMILDEQCPRVDIEIAKSELERKVEKLFPDKMDLYRMIYEARFDRLWQQFRSDEEKA